jgi:xanthine dehydrogenase large subunit
MRASPKERPETAVVAKALAHDSGERHVKGTALYIDDIVEPVGTLHVAPGYTLAGCGPVAKLDLSRVRTAPGVVAVLTAEDIPGINDCSPSIGDDQVLADGETVFPGQVIFVVVAESHLLARKAARLAEIEIEAKTPVVTVDDAIGRTDDVLPPYEFNKGDAEAGLRAAPRRISGEITIGGQEHFYLEGQAALAVPGEEGDMLVYTSTQHPSEVQHTVAKVLALRDAQVVCECRRMGGGFGGKESQATQWATIAALAARATGRPVKIRLDRDDDMVLTGKRHDAKASWQAGVDEAGRLQAVDISIAARCGCSADLSLGVNDRMMFHADNAYCYPQARIRSRRLRTNTVSNTAFRGFGGPQGMMAAEHMMDSLAIALGIDPLDVRKQNFYAPGRDVTPYGMTVEEHVIGPLVEELEATSDYRARRTQVQAFNTESRLLKKGLALTPVKFGISFTLIHLNQAGALVHVYTDGSVHLNHGGTEMGQGLYVKVAQVVAEVFGIDLERVRITATTTAKVPNTSPTAASSGSDLNGMAARVAAETIKGRLIELAAEVFEVEASEIEFRDSRVWAGNESLPFEELAKKAHQARISLSSTGFYRTPKIHWDRDQAKGRPFLYFANGAACSEVTIDTLTGEMRVDRVDILHDVGRSLNPAIDIGQIEGGFVQGMGWLTAEELVYDHGGRLLSHAPSTYKIPTASDLPADFRVALYRSEGNPEKTIFRSKAVGEPPLMLGISVFSAITDAVASLQPGTVPPLDTPATPEAIQRACAAMKEGS